MNYYPYFLIIFVLILSLPLIMILTSKIVRFIAGYTNQTSDSIYECGEPRVENSWTKIPIGYFKVALIFILFDILFFFLALSCSEYGYTEKGNINPDSESCIFWVIGGGYREGGVLGACPLCI